MKRLLIVEDDPAVSRVLERALRGAGYELVVVSSGLDALEAIRSGSIDGLVADMHGRFGGRALCEQLRAGGESLPPLVFVLTSRSGPEERRWLRSFPGVQLVEKPVSPQRFLRLLEERRAVGHRSGEEQPA